MKKPRGPMGKSPLTVAEVADQLLKRLIKAGAVDSAYIARLDHRAPKALNRHPDETTSVGVQELFRDDEPSGSPASRIAKLHRALEAMGIELCTTGAEALAPARAGTVRVFRAETDRIGRNGGVFAGWKASPAARGGYFTTGLAAAHRYSEPRVAPQGAPLRYVDLPESVADVASLQRPENTSALRARGQRLAARRITGVLQDDELHLDREWAGRAVAVPPVTEEPLVRTGDAALDARGWVLGREQLQTVKSPVDLQMTVQYVSGEQLRHQRGNVPSDWQPASTKRRCYANAELIIPLGDQRVLFIRTGDAADSIAFLNSLAATPETRDRADYCAVVSALVDVPFMVTGTSAMTLRGERKAGAAADRSVEIAVPHDALAVFARVVTRASMMVEGATRRLGNKDKASLVRRLRATDEAVTFRSAELGSITVKPVTTSEFTRMSRESHRATVSVLNDDGICEILTVRVARRSTVSEEVINLWTTGFELELQRYLQHPTDSAG